MNTEFWYFVGPIEMIMEKLNVLRSMADTVWFKQIFLSLCPNKRVVHLATHGSKKTQKKNFHRAIKIMGKEGA